MEKNVGGLDRAIRIGLAIVLLLMAVMFRSIILAIPGVIFLATAILGTCWLYKFFKINTRCSKYSEDEFKDLKI